MKTGWKWFWRVAAVVGVCVLVLAVNGILRARSMGFLRSPVFETERPQLPDLHHPAVLVFSKTNSFIHKEAIPAARAYLREAGDAAGWSVFEFDGGGIFNAEDLSQFDVVVWNNVTGDVLLPEQREAFRAWLERGGGFVALHSAGDDSHDAWPWYQDSVIRARFTGHPLDPQFQSARVIVEQPADPIASALPEPWQRTDEWYSFERSPRAPDLTVIAALDEASYAPGEMFGKALAMGADHPIIWKHCVGSGRVFYSAMGHTAESYGEPEYREVLRRAILWAADPQACEVSLAPESPAAPAEAMPDAPSEPALEPAEPAR